MCKQSPDMHAPVRGARPRISGPALVASGKNSRNFHKAHASMEFVGLKYSQGLAKAYFSARALHNMPT